VSSVFRAGPNMELEYQMLVSEFAQNVINNRPLKYGARQSYIKIIKSLGIWETEISDLNCALIFDKVDQMRSHNVKKNVYICLRSVFKDLGIFNDLPILYFTICSIMMQIWAHYLF
jgi:hypothetical protein